MQEPSDVATPIPLGIRTTARGDPCTVGQRTFMAQLGSVVRRVPEALPDFQRQLLQQLWSDHVVGITGDSALRRQRNPEAADDDRQRQLPAVPPAVIPGLTPGGFGVNRGLRDFPGQPMFLVPHTAVGAPGRTVASRGVARRGPGLQQRDQMAPQTAKQRGPPRREGRKASFPGAPCGQTSVLRQQETNLRRDGIVWCEKVAQSLGRIEAPNDHDDPRLDKAFVGIELLPPAFACGWWRRSWNLLDEPE
jgi:hypothetical protein